MRAAIALLAAAACLALVGCGGSGTEAGMSGGIADGRHYAADGYMFADSREVVCWGDSMTQGDGASYAIIHTATSDYDASGMSYPEVLQHFTHLRTFNFGVSGADSLEIAAMQGAVPREDLPEDSLYYDDNLAKLSKSHPGDILILEIGSNGGWDADYDELIDQYEAMLSYANCTDFIILGDTDDPGTSFADYNQWEFGSSEGANETEWERALREHFGDHFLNVRLFLVQNGLRVTGLNASVEDAELAAHGCVSPQLRADWTHLNSYGYYAKALGVYEQGKRLGYWQ